MLGAMAAATGAGRAGAGNGSSTSIRSRISDRRSIRNCYAVVIWRRIGCVSKGAIAWRVGINFGKVVVQAPLLCLLCDITELSFTESLTYTNDSRNICSPVRSLKQNYEEDLHRELLRHPLSTGCMYPSILKFPSKS